MKHGIGNDDDSGSSLKHFHGNVNCTATRRYFICIINMTKQVGYAYQINVLNIKMFVTIMRK